MMHKVSLSSIMSRISATHHRGVCPPRLSVCVFLASLPRRAAQYGSCLPMVRLLGRLRARSMIATSVPMIGPSTLMSEKMPAVWAPPKAAMLSLAAMVAVVVVVVIRDRRSSRRGPS